MDSLISQVGQWLGQLNTTWRRNFMEPFLVSKRHLCSIIDASQYRPTHMKARISDVFPKVSMHLPYCSILCRNGSILFMNIRLFRLACSSCILAIVLLSSWRLVISNDDNSVDVRQVSSLNASKAFWKISGSCWVLFAIANLEERRSLPLQ